MANLRAPRFCKLPPNQGKYPPLPINASLETINHKTHFERLSLPSHRDRFHLRPPIREHYQTCLDFQQAPGLENWNTSQIVHSTLLDSKAVPVEVYFATTKPRHRKTRLPAYHGSPLPLPCALLVTVGDVGLPSSSSFTFEQAPETRKLTRREATSP